MSSDFDRKYEKALQELRGTTIWESSYLPLAHRILKSRDFESRPPHYNSFLSNAIQMGIYFGIVWGLLMWLFQWSQWNLPIIVALVASMGAGLFFGFSMASYYKNSAKNHSLSDWEEL